MNINEFAQMVVDGIQKELGEGYEISLRNVPKNNGVALLGLVIVANGQNVSPTIYMESFKAAYEEGMPLSDIIESVLDIYGQGAPQENIDMEFFKDFEQVKGRICFRLINREKNRELLAQIPHVEFLDLAICFHYAYQGNELGNGSILIFNNHVEMWHTSAAALYELAERNTPVLFPWESRGMEDILDGFMQKEPGITAEELGIPEEIPMKILKNRSNSYGAACILYPGVLEELAKKQDADFYILPSSVHEVILLEDSGDEDADTLREMIADVNDTQVEPEEILSYSLYYFSRTDNHVRIF